MSRRWPASPVVLVDVNPEALDKALATIAQEHGPAGRARARIAAAAQATRRWPRITTGTDYRRASATATS